MLPRRCPACRWRESDTGFSMELREPVVLMQREPFKWRTHKNLSTDARHWGGVARISDEVTVMVMERRGDVRRSCPCSTGLSRRRCG
jgi:hypothetical protein